MTEVDQYKKRMQRKKQHIDDTIEKAGEERGVIVLLTGNGKGKSSSAFGMAVRAIGHGMRVGIVQFIKAWTNTGEQLFFDQHQQAAFHIMGTGFTWDTQDREKDRLAANHLWQKVEPMLADPGVGLVVLDELTYMLNYGYLDETTVLTALRQRPRHQHVVITGRAAKDCLVDIADTVTDMQDKKHAFRSGVKAMPGVEW